MVDYFGFDMDENGTAVSDRDFTLSEIATSIIPALIGMMFLALIAVLILPYRGLLWLSGLPTFASRISGSDRDSKVLARP